MEEEDIDDDEGGGAGMKGKNSNNGRGGASSSLSSILQSGWFVFQDRFTERRTGFWTTLRFGQI